MQFFLKIRQRPTFPGSRPPSIIGAKELNYCVRYGNRCDLPAIVTGSLNSQPDLLRKSCGILQLKVRYLQNQIVKWDETDSHGSYLKPLVKRSTY